MSFEMVMQRNENPCALYTLMAGGLAGTFSWLVSFPVDVVKSRLQVDGIDGKPKYNGAIDCMKKSFAAEGWRFFTRGLNSTLMRAFPMNAVCFFVVTYIMKHFTNQNIDITVTQPDKLAIVDAYPQTFIMRVFNRQQTENHHRHKTTKYLIFLDGFHEASCHSDMMDLSDELREKRYSTTYFYKMNDGLLTKNLSEEELKTPLL